MKHLSLGIAGTAKNTGKTTTTAALMAALRANGLKMAITSIGYDGETIDNVTGLPKPRLLLAEGDLFATAETCLQVNSAGVDVLAVTDITTPLGNVAIGRVVREGFVVMAGPNKSRQLRQIIDTLAKYGPNMTIVDGALNRMAPMVETDGFILATGAARNPDIAALAKETRALERIFMLPVIDAVPAIDHAAVLDRHLSPGRLLPFSSLFARDQLEQCWREITSSAKYLYIPGIITEPCLGQLAERLESGSHFPILVFKDPIKIAIAGAPAEISKVLERMNGYIAVAERIPLLAVTVNPFYPQYRYETDSYQPAFVDRGILLATMRATLTAPVYDIVHEGVDPLVRDLLKWIGGQ